MTLDDLKRENPEQAENELHAEGHKVCQNLKS